MCDEVECPRVFNARVYIYDLMSQNIRIHPDPDYLTSEEGTLRQTK